MSTTPLRIEVVESADARVLRPTGVLDLSSSTQLRHALLKCVTDEPPAVVVDLSELELESWALLSVFVAVAMRAAEWPGVPLLLASPHPGLLEPMRRSGLARFVPTYGTVSEALLAPTTPAPRRRAELHLSRAPSMPSLARRFVGQTCLAWGLPQLHDDALLVVSELVTNTMRHTASDAWVRVELRPMALTIAVRDEDPRPPRRASAPPTALTGRGSTMIDALSSAWGHMPARSGKVVWVSLARERPRH
jgi:anti-anti-sigma factor